MELPGEGCPCGAARQETDLKLCFKYSEARLRTFVQTNDVLPTPRRSYSKRTRNRKGSMIHEALSLVELPGTAPGSIR